MDTLFRHFDTALQEIRGERARAPHGKDRYARGTENGMSVVFEAEGKENRVVSFGTPPASRIGTVVSDGVGRLRTAAGAGTERTRAFQLNVDGSACRDGSGTRNPRR